MSTPASLPLALPEPAERREEFELKVTVVRATGLPKVDSFARQTNGKFYAVLTIGEERRETKVARRSSAPEWNQLFSFDAHPNSTLKIEIFARRKMRRDEYIGFVADSISVICPSMFEGGPQDVTKTISGEPGARIVLRFETNVDVDTVRQLPVNEILPAIPDGLAPQQMPQEVPADPIPENMPDLERRLSQVHSLRRPASTIEGASSLSSETGYFGATWGPLFDNIKIFCEFTDKLVEVHPYAKMAWNFISLPVKIVQKQMERDDNILKLFDIMNSLYSIVNDLKEEFEDKPEKAGPLQDLFIRIARQTTECYYFISEYANTEGFIQRTGRNPISLADDTITKFCDAFIELRKEFDTGVAVQTGIVAISILDKVEYVLDGVEHILNDTENIRIESDLNEIRHVPEASFDKNKGCQPGTRTAILDEIAAWINEEDAPRVLLLSGAAGTGKSAIAHTIAHRFKGLNRLGSSFCFVRGEAGRGPERLFAHIARDLADFDECIRRTLWKIVQGDTALRTTLHMGKQFNNFILKLFKELTLTGPLVIVIDALDESGDIRSRQELLQLLAEKTADLPSNVRILLTSRPEGDVDRLFHSGTHILVKKMQDISMTSTEVDITAYIHTRLSGPAYSAIDDARRSELVSKCEGLFQWASVACTFIIGLGITGLKPLDRYNLLIQGEVEEIAGLDGLYTTVLSYLFPHRSAALDKTIIGSFQFIMALVLTTFEPVSLRSLNEISRSVEDGIISLRPESILGGMGSVLRGVTEEEPIRPWHTSFRDFLLDRTRSGRFHVDTSRTHRDLTLASLHIMQNQLVFNICRLESSHLLNKDVPDLADRVQKSIPGHLSYSCRFWTSHLQAIDTDAASDPKLLKGVEIVLKDKFLFWLEVMSLLSAISRAARAIASVVEWTRGQDTSQLSKLASDAHAFMNVFGLPISQSTPHIYVSALAFAPQSSAVSERFGEDFPHVLKVSAGQHSIHADSGVECVAISPDGWWIVSGLVDGTILMSDVSTDDAVDDFLEGHTGAIKSVAFSADGSRIMSSSQDNTIRVWDALTHAALGDPYQVNSIDFSTDGLRIVSGSSDNTIRVWDTTTCAPVGNPLEGHTGPVDSVAFSPDGMRIVSGSSDHTIRVWDIMTCAAVGDPLTGHIGPVKSVAFSLDGKRIVSGSWDKTVRVWDVSTRAAVGNPLEGHTGSVDSVAFSPDGKRIVSGSDDNTIRVWDAVTRDAVGDPLGGHTDSVNSVAFSPDGKRIVSRSSDNTIWEWDIATCAAASEPLEGHMHWVNCVAFSPDGSRIVSGSYDRTIRVWDMATCTTVGDPLEGHTDSVNSVAFSPDGKWIVSGSHDNTLRLWDAATCAAVGGPLKGHTNWVNSVAFSPDGERVVSGSHDCTIRLWDVETHTAVGKPLEGHTEWVNSVAFSPDGMWIVSGSSDNTVRVWHAATCAAVGDPLVGHTGPVFSVAVSPDGLRILSSSWDKTIQVWDAVMRVAVGPPLQGHADCVRSVAFSPDGKRIVSGSDDQKIRLWNTVICAAVGDPLEGHTDWVDSVAFSPDGKRIASGSHDHTIRLWDVPFAQPVPTKEVDDPENAPPTRQSRYYGMRPTSIQISPYPEHAMRKDDLCGSMPPPPCDCRTSEHMNNDGWIVGPGSKLLFWVPPTHRDKLWPDSRLRTVMGREYVQLDLSQFVHGSSWHECYRPSPQ